MRRSSAVPKSDIMGVADAVEVTASRVVLENRRGLQYILPGETMRNPKLDLTTVFKVGEKVVYKANHLKVAGFDHKVYIVIYAKKLAECQVGEGYICDVQPTYGSIKAKNRASKIFFPAGSFGDYRADLFYCKIKDCKKFFRLNDPVTYTAVPDSTSNSFYCLNFDLRLNEDDTKPFIGVVVDVTTEFCRLWVKNYDSVRLNGSEIWPNLMDVKQVLEIGDRVEFTCHQYPRIDNVRLLDDLAKVRLEKYKKNYKPELRSAAIALAAEKRGELNSNNHTKKQCNGIGELVDRLELQSADKQHRIISANGDKHEEDIMPVHVTVKGLATVKTVKPSYCVLYSEKVGDVLVLISDWLRYKEDYNYGKDADRKVDLRKVFVFDELVYFEGYFYPGHTRDGYRADRVEKTIDGRAVVARLNGTYGFLFSVNLREIFFAGAVVYDDFCGLRNLEKTLRINDEVRFVAVKEREGRQAYTTYKAVAVVLPTMGKENDENCTGVVVDVTSSYAKLYCRPLGPVFLTFTQSIHASTIKVGDRLKFTCRRFNGRYEAFGSVYEALPRDFVFKFSQFSPQKPALCDSLVAGASRVSEKSSNVVAPPAIDIPSPEQFDNKFNVLRENNQNATVSRRRGFEQDDTNVEDFCWADLEKELAEITCDLPSKNAADNICDFPAKTTSPVLHLSSSSFSSSATSVENRQTVSKSASPPNYLSHSQYDNRLFDHNDGYFSIFKDNNNNSAENSENEFWPVFSPKTVLTDLSQTQTTSNNTENQNVSPSAISADEFPVAHCGAAPGVIRSAAYLANDDGRRDSVFKKSYYILQEMMKDSEIFKIAAERRSDLVFEYSSLHNNYGQHSGNESFY